ncbi:PLDc N-terminal domain-containing protein [Antarcticibacterium sp. 1MA-6-2]|uniref:PLDc N-terminal domain-containing protein n=1 Tax=Antarcticibacterium sp. 1MA-6-2 TaxID=2908210 RepID=UPI0038FC09DE
MGLEFSLITIILLSVALLLLPVIAIIHLIRSGYKGRGKIIWLLIILFLPFLGSVLYFIMGKRYRRHNPE